MYVSRDADMGKAIPIVVNAKVQRPGVCNAMETLLLDAALPLENRRDIVRALLDKGVTLFGDLASCKLSPAIKPATVDDWKAEYLDLRLAVRTVNGVGKAIEHINEFGSHHTDSIVTESLRRAIPPGGGFLVGHGEREHAVFRWRRIRHGMRDRDFNR